MVKPLMQLPQLVFRIRSNAVVLFKQHTTETFHGGHRSLFSTKPVVSFISKWRALKVLKCCPNFPLRRQNKDNEANVMEHAEDNSRNILSFSREIEHILLASLSQSWFIATVICGGCDFYASFGGYLQSWGVVHIDGRCGCGGLRLWLLQAPRNNTELSTNRPKLTQCSLHHHLHPEQKGHLCTDTQLSYSVAM